MTATEPLIFSAPLIAASVLVIVLAGSIVQAGLGMGFGLTVAPVLALIDPALVPASALYLGMMTSAAGAVREWPNIVWKEVWIGSLARTAGMMAGLIILLSLTDQAAFSLVFGIVILSAVLLSVAGWRLAFNFTNLSFMGLVSGFMGIITSVGAPPLALIYQGRDSIAARPTLAAFFTVGCAVSLISLYATGYAGTDEMWGALFMAPAALAGTWAGRRMQGRFDKRYRPALLFIAACASILLILRGLSNVA